MGTQQKVLTMAEFGKGDPRWQVSDRADGRNVNSWHWEEKDISLSAKEVLGEAFEHKPLGEKLNIDSFIEIEGEATLMKRKGKISVIYELNTKFYWSGTFANGPVRGQLGFPEISHDITPKDTQVNVSFLNSFMTREEETTLRGILREGAKKLVGEFQQKILQDWDTTVKTEKVQASTIQTQRSAHSIARNNINWKPIGTVALCVGSLMLAAAVGYWFAKSQNE